MLVGPAARRRRGDDSAVLGVHRRSAQRLRPDVARGRWGEHHLGGLAQRGDRRHRLLRVQHTAPRSSRRLPVGRVSKTSLRSPNGYIVSIDQGRLKAKDISGGAVVQRHQRARHPDGPRRVRLARRLERPGQQLQRLRQGPRRRLRDRRRNLGCGGGVPGLRRRTGSSTRTRPSVGARGIRLYDIGTGQTTVVSEQTWNEWRPAISGNRVVWQAWPGPARSTPQGIQIFGTNLARPRLRRQPRDRSPDRAGDLRFDGGLGGRPNRPESQIFWRDLATTMPPVGVEGSLPGSQQAASLFGRRVVLPRTTQRGRGTSTSGIRLLQPWDRLSLSK